MNEKKMQRAKLGDIGKIETGTTPSKINPNYYGTDYPLFKPSDLEQGINTLTAHDNLSIEGFNKCRKLPKNSILVTCIGATIGKTGLIKIEGASNQQINAVLPNNEHDPKFVYYQIISSSFQNQIKNNASSTTLPILNKTKFQQLTFITTPLPIQQAIVAKLEALFSELDKGIEQLKTAQQQLRTYRQAVLKAAFEGRLTGEQVKEGELPEGWKWIELREFISGIDAGKSFKCEERPPRENEVGVLKVSAVTWGEFDEEESKTVTDSNKVNQAYFVKEGDFILSRANTIELVGNSVIVRKITKNLMLSDKTLRIRFSNKLNQSFTLHFLRSQFGRKQIEKLSTGNQESMRNIGQERIKQIKIPYCDTYMQLEVVAEIESRLSVADKMEEAIAQGLQQAEALRQSILKKAFEGG
jgi:type I restriction enzyme S subunit